MTAEKIPLVAVMGSPIAHSKSPMLHGYWLRKYGIKGHYIPIDVDPTHLSQVLETMSKMGFVGANVTIPHKENILKLADKISDRAAMIGAANTLSFSANGQIYADNTDGYGFIENIRQHQPTWKVSEGPALILGAGGAARAVVSSLLENGTPELWITNRTRARAEKIASDFGARVKVIDWFSVNKYLSGATTVVNATSLGMIGKPEMAIDLKPLTKKSLITDLVYTPLQTPLLIQAAQKGCRTVDGIGMLIHQAVPGFTRWFKTQPIVDKAVRELLLT